MKTTNTARYRPEPVYETIPRSKDWTSLVYRLQQYTNGMDRSMLTAALYLYKEVQAGHGGIEAIRQQQGVVLYQLVEFGCIGHAFSPAVHLIHRPIHRNNSQQSASCDRKTTPDRVPVTPVTVWQLVDSMSYCVQSSRKPSAQDISLAPTV